MNYTIFNEDKLEYLKKYFDEIYIFNSDIMTEIDSEMTYGTTFYKWVSVKDFSGKFFKDELKEIELNSGYGKYSFRVYFKQKKDTYIKILFIKNYSNIDNALIPEIMRYYFKSNRRNDYKVFDQKRIQNQFISEFIALYANSAGKLVQNILNISIDPDSNRRLYIEDKESYNSVTFTRHQCLEISAFFEYLSEILLP